MDSQQWVKILNHFRPFIKNYFSLGFFFWQRRLWSLAQLWEELYWLQSLRELFWFWWNVVDLVIERISCFWQKMTQTTSSRCNLKSDWLIIGDTDNIFLMSSLIWLDDLQWHDNTIWMSPQIWLDDYQSAHITFLPDIFYSSVIEWFFLWKWKWC